MNINITRFFADGDHFNISGSRMEHGQDAGRITWNNARDAVKEFCYLDTEDKLDAMRSHLRDIGFSESGEDKDADELNALFLQLVAGDIREVPDMEPGCWDWEAYEDFARLGTIHAAIYRGDDGDVYYYLGD